MGTEYRELKKSIKALELTTVCEEAGCPNIFECWGQGTATFMALGERCTRACGFCLVDTRKPQAIDPDEPKRIAEAVNQMNLEYAVITMVARDDLKDGGAKHISEIINEVRSLNPQTSVEVLISDLKGNSDHLQTIFSAKPDVMNHNIETVPRLQRQVRPSAGYARSLAVLALAKKEGLVVKSSIMVGLGETEQEMFDTLKDLKEIGVDIVTIGQYLRPTMNHLPVQRWWTPEEFNELKRIGEALGIPHVESSPLTRSSYHAKESETLAKNKANSLTTSGSK
jgi:lipoic acid synthetase